jgi:hypothetical protein
MFSIFVKAATYVLGALGITELFDRFVKPQVPAQYYPEPIAVKRNIPGFVWFIAAFCIAAVVFTWAAKKFKMTFLPKIS